jgi:hypothetical protein
MARALVIISRFAIVFVAAHPKRPARNLYEAKEIFGR